MIATNHHDRRQELVACLETAQREIDAKVVALRSEVEQLELERERLGDAIAALTGATPEKRRRRGSQASGNGTRASEFVGIVSECFDKDDELSEEELKSRVSQRFIAEGRSRQGLHFALRGALRDDRFRCEDGVVRVLRP